MSENKENPTPEKVKDEGTSDTSDLKTEIQNLINCHSRENVSNTPDFILARYLMDCLQAFEKATNIRTSLYGRTEWRKSDD